MKCPNCKEQMIGFEYAYGNRNRYDGVSEWLCEKDNLRIGRWTGKILKDNESEPRFGGKP